MIIIVVNITIWKKQQLCFKFYLIKCFGLKKLFESHAQKLLTIGIFILFFCLLVPFFFFFLNSLVLVVHFFYNFDIRIVCSTELIVLLWLLPYFKQYIFQSSFVVQSLKRKGWGFIYFRYFPNTVKEKNVLVETLWNKSYKMNNSVIIIIARINFEW